jgi:hypothetical protein
MFDTIKNFIEVNHFLIWTIISILIAIAIISQKSMQLWIRDFWVRFPVIGSLARLAKNHTHGNKSWMRSEEELCGIYKPYVSMLSLKVFNERIEYMRKAGDLGRTPIPLWVISLLALLVVAEGLGFSFILGSWMARDGSANTHTLLMLAIVFVLATILLAVTHAAGHQYYRTSLLRSCFARFKGKGGQEYSSKSVALTNPQNVDDNEPDYVQTVNRVANHSRDTGSFAMGIIALIAIIVIAVSSTAMRWENLQGELTKQSIQESAAGNPFDNIALPTEVTAPQHAADQKAKTEVSDSTKIEGLSAFFMLGFIFVITQIVGMGAGYKYGFVGKETYSKIEGKWFQKTGAYADTGGVSTYESYVSLHEPLLDLANSRLKELQQRMEANSHEKLALNKNFVDYLREQKKNASEAFYADEAPANNNNTALDNAIAEISNIAEDDIEAQQAYYSGLTASVQSEIKPWLKQRKDKRLAALAQKNKEMEDLF